MKVKRFRAVEVATTSLALWWGLILIMPFSTFGLSVSYNAMVGVADENTWAVYMLALGLLQFVSMLTNNIFLKQISLLAATGTWFFVATMFGFGNIFNTATGTYAIVAFLTGWLYTKVGGQNGR